MKKTASPIESLPSTLQAYAVLLLCTGLLFPLARALEIISGPAAWSRLLRVWARLALRLGPVRLQPAGAAIPSGPAVFICNHQSSLDILILAALLPAPCLFVARSELFRQPIVGTVLARGGHIPLLRGRRREVAGMAVRVLNSLRQGRSVVIFPEGRRSRTGEIGPFHLGAFRLARRAGVAVTPLTLAGTRAILPPRRRSIRAGTVFAVVHEPLAGLLPGETTQQQARRARQLMAQTLMQFESRSAAAETTGAAVAGRHVST